VEREMKAMILAAGRGRRLEHHTKNTAKPLIEVGGEMLIGHNIKALAKADFKDIVINVAYRADEIINALGDGSQFGVNIQYSVEEEGGLETGGGIYNALPLLGEDPFVTVSCDLYTKYDFSKLRNQPKELAHLVLIEPRHGNTPDYSLDNNLLTRKDAKYTWSSIGVYHPKFFERCEPGFFSVVPIIDEAALKGKVTGEIMDDIWYNINVEKNLEDLRQHLG